MLSFVIGALVLFFVFADFLQTTLGAQKAGRISRVVAAGLWLTAKGVRVATGRWVHRYSGPYILALVAAFWIAVHWAAWVLIHRSDPASVVMMDSGEPASLVQTIAYVGASISTLGASLAEPSGAWWDLAASLAAVNGMVVLTLSVTFVLNITQTVTEGRTFAVLVNSFEPGDTARTDAYIKQLADIASKFNAFPMALYFSTPIAARRVVPAIAEFVDRALSEETLPKLRPVLAMLPGLEVEGDANGVRAAVEEWTERYTLGGTQRS